MSILIKTLEIVSDDFPGNGMIPDRFSCRGKNINPSFTLPELPEGTRSLAVIAEDPDAPGGWFVHWVAWNIPPAGRIPEDLQQGIKGINSKQKPGYTGPCPPEGMHRYYFKFYALDTMLGLAAGAGKMELLEAMKDHIIAGGECLGYFEYRRSSL